MELLEQRNGELRNLCKFDKHRSYLISEAEHSPRPKYFYFAVPVEFDVRAEAELQTTPYGLLVDLGNFVVVKKHARPLSPNKFDDHFYFLRKVSNENYRLRVELLSHGVDPKILDGPNP